MAQKDCLLPRDRRLRVWLGGWRVRDDLFRINGTCTISQSGHGADDLSSNADYVDPDTNSGKRRQ